MSSKKTTDTTQNQNSTSTTTPNVPDWLLNPAQTVAGQFGTLLGGNASDYTPQTSALQQGAFNAAPNLSTSPDLGAAAGMVSGAQPVHGSSLLTNLSSYYNPFESAVMDPTMAAFDQQAGMTTAQQEAQGAQSQAFGGSRYGIQQAQTAGQLALARAQTQGGLLNDMYGQAVTASNEDAGRQQQADLANQSSNLTGAGLLANIGQDTDASHLANLNAQDVLGSQETAQNNTAAQYPLTYQTQLESLLQGLNTGQYSGQTTDASGTSNTHETQTSDPGVLGALGTAAQIAALFATGGMSAAASLGASAASGTLGSFMSDRRLKRDAVQVGVRGDGLKLWLFRYLWSPIWHVGVMAQEVLKVKPHAVARHPDGFFMVNYGALNA